MINTTVLSKNGTQNIIYIYSVSKTSLFEWFISIIIDRMSNKWARNFQYFDTDVNRSILDTLSDLVQPSWLLLHCWMTPHGSHLTTTSDHVKTPCIYSHVITMTVFMETFHGTCNINHTYIWEKYEAKSSKFIGIQSYFPF